MDDKLDIDRVIDLGKVDEEIHDKRVELLPEPVGLEVPQVEPWVPSNVGKWDHHQLWCNDNLESTLVILHDGDPFGGGGIVPHRLDFALPVRS